MNEWNWVLIVKQESLTEGPAWNGSELLYSQCPASLTWSWNPNNNKNTVWREETNGSNGMLFDQEGNLYACEGEGRRLVQYSKGKETVIISDNFDGKSLVSKLLKGDSSKSFLKVFRKNGRCRKIYK